MKLIIIKALWKTIRELDVVERCLILSVICGIPFLLGGIFNSIIITNIFGFGFIFFLFRAFWIMGKEDFKEFVNKVKGNMNKL